ncbi:hypothetical protein PINS_up024297 [Pythium insidiosum]|nr:hypothetical protein PINS_up024297 [Pythium insidiosum]
MTYMAVAVSGGAMVTWLSTELAPATPSDTIDFSTGVQTRDTDRSLVFRTLCGLYSIGNSLSLLAARYPAVCQFVSRHMYCTSEGLWQHKRWHTLLTSSFITSSWGGLLMLASVILFGVDATMEPYFDMASKGDAPDPLAKFMPEGMPAQLPLWSFISVFATSAVASNVKSSSHASRRFVLVQASLA